MLAGPPAQARPSTTATSQSASAATSAARQAAKKAAAKKAAAKKAAAKKAAAKKKAKKKAAAKKAAAKKAAAKKKAKKKAKSSSVKKSKKPASSSSKTAAAQPSGTPAQPAASAPNLGIAAAAGTWMSGAAGDGVADGSFAAWRGSPVPIAGTWADTSEAQREMWAVQPGADYGNWQGDLDIAVGAIFQDEGESWAAAASGAYDARWRAALKTLMKGWGSRPGTLHIRFAHEFNGNWVPWQVTGAEAGAFVATWKRFRTLQLEIAPKAKLVFCANIGSSGSLGLDWRKAFPGAAYVDEMSVDSYNDWPYVNSAAAFNSKINLVDSYGAPMGLEKHRLFAASVGLPLAISEWSSNSVDGDGDGFMKLFYNWVATHAGTAAGQIPYEIIFNVGYFKDGLYQVFPKTAMPQAASVYRSIF